MVALKLSKHMAANSPNKFVQLTTTAEFVVLNAGSILNYNVLINLYKTFFAPGQAYVALSRVAIFDYLYLMSFDLSSFIVNP